MHTIFKDTFLHLNSYYLIKRQFQKFINQNQRHLEHDKLIYSHTITIIQCMLLHMVLIHVRNTWYKMHQYFLQLTNNKYFLAGSSSLLNKIGGRTSQIDQDSAKKWNPFPSLISVITLKVKFGEVRQKANTQTHTHKRNVVWRSVFMNAIK